MAQNLTRKKSLNFRVTPKEHALIKRRMAQTGVTNFRAYLLKMAVDGRVITVELDCVKEMNRLLSNVTNNVNQIARRVNGTGNIYGEDIADIMARQEEILAQQNEIIATLAKFVAAI